MEEVFLRPRPRRIALRLLPLWGWGLLLALALGVVFRLIWVADIEYKLDEAWTYKHVLAAGHTEPMPMIGMPSSLGPPNPPLSFWATWGLTHLFGVQTPLGLARVFQVLNVMALAALAAFILLSIPREQREPWAWAAALGAVNPLAVLFQRKIWPPTLAPLFGVAWLAGWWHRRQTWGAFVWGLLGALLGQLHAAGFFLAGGLFAFTLLFGRQGVRWKAWFVGSVLGALSMLPWLHVLLTQPREFHGQSAPALRHFLEAKFYTYWMTEPFGIGLTYPLGREFQAFLAGPSWQGHSTYLAGLMQLACCVLGGLIVGRAVMGLWQRRDEMRARLLGRGSETSFLVAGAFWGFGLLLSLCCLRFYRHYLVVAFPLGFLWVAVLALRGVPGEKALRQSRMLLAALCVSQALLTASFLRYVHLHPDHIAGDYAMPYRVQEERGKVTGCDI